MERLGVWDNYESNDHNRHSTDLDRCCLTFCSIMYLGGLKYTPLTATLGALVLGIASEYAILMMKRFYEELKNVGDPFEALKITANRIGSALVASGMTVVFGFGALSPRPSISPATSDW